MTHPASDDRDHRRWRSAYRALLVLLPRALRERQGEAMVHLFGRELQRSEAAGTSAVWVAGLTGLADLTGRGLYERVAEERRALTVANVAVLRRAALVFLVVSVGLTAALVLRSALTLTSAPRAGSVLDVILYSIPYTAALTIPISVFIAVLWAAGRGRPAAGRVDHPATAGSLRVAPALGMASVMALCCLVLNAELVPRANARLLAVHGGGSATVATNRTMTLRELHAAETRLVSASPVAPIPAPARASLARYEVEIQKKLALAAACVVLTLLAAAIAGGVAHVSAWAQAAISIVVFGSYYVNLIVGEHLAEQLVIPPVLAMWSANIMALTGAMLLWRAARKRRARDGARYSPAT